MKANTICLLIAILMVSTTAVIADPMDDLIQSLVDDYESLTPAPNSSVGTDYPTKQAALGSLYTARSIGLIYQQNQDMISRQEELGYKYDEIIEQNREIIRLLTIISERVTPIADAPPGMPGEDFSDQ